MTTQLTTSNPLFQELTQFIKNNDIEAIKSSNNASQIDVNAVDDDGRTLFFLACVEKKLELAQFFLDKKSNINHKDSDSQFSPLHVAASQGSADVVHFLLSNYPDVNITNISMQTPLHYACSKGHLKIVELLLEFTPSSKYFASVKPSEAIKLNMQDSTGSTPLVRAIVNGHINIVKLLIENEGDVNRADNEGNTPVHHAIYECHDEIAKLLVTSGAILTSSNAGGKNPIDIADMKLAKILVSLYEENKD